MKKNFPMPASKSVFNFKVLLDDLIEPISSENSATSFEFCSPSGAHELKAKMRLSECKTSKCTEKSEWKSDFESPTKAEIVKPSKCERLRKSDGALTRYKRKKHGETKNFLTDASEDENKASRENDDWGRVFGGQSRGSKFSLSSCFKDNFSHFGQKNFMESKLNVEFPSKIRRKKLKAALRGRHFERILKRVSVFVENGEPHSSFFF